MGKAMKEIVSTITSKGQVTIPAAVRRHLGVSTNDKITFVLEDSGEVRLKMPSFRSVADLRGAAGTLKQPRPWQEMREIAREDRLTERHASKL
jgi:AbrB family looped-hinge helix DNA binding protein